MNHSSNNTMHLLLISLDDKLKNTIAKPENYITADKHRKCYRDIQDYDTVYNGKDNILKRGKGNRCN